jgi:hypothetical protein
MTLIGCHSRAGYENRYHRDPASIAYIESKINVEDTEKYLGK